MPLPFGFEAPAWMDAAWPQAVAFLTPFVLAWLRFLGMLWMAPVFGDAAVSIRIRVVLAALLAGVAAPVVAAPLAFGMASWGDVIWLGLGELVLGGALGLGVRLVLSGLTLAAALIDQQSGLAMAQTLNPQFGEPATPTGPLLAVAGTFALLTAPVGAELQLTSTVLETFRTLPPGGMSAIEGPVQLVQDVTLAAITLGLQVAAPCVAAMGLVQVGWAFVTRNGGTAAASMTLVPARVLGCLLILAITLSGISYRIVECVDDVLAGSRSVAASESPEGRP
jgi:flagellar biosynthetic protein FliR